MQQNRIKPYAAIKRRVVSPAGIQWLPNRVQRQFTVVRNQVWVTDITYIRTKGWLYLAVVIDLFARNYRLVDASPDLKATLSLTH
jgi:transposase InsO family protein